LNPHGPFKPCGFSYRLRLSPPGRGAFWRAHARFAVWTIPSPSSGKFRSLGAARLVSTPSRLVSLRAWLGIAIRGFPEFEQFCIAGFPASTQGFLKSAAYAIPPRPRVLFHFQLSIIEHTRVNYTLASCRRLDRSGVFVWFRFVFGFGPMMIDRGGIKLRLDILGPLRLPISH
jgi:hypothetical protein